MNNLMNLEGHAAVISFDTELDLFRGEFTGLDGGADFYANSIEASREGRARKESVPPAHFCPCVKSVTLLHTKHLRINPWFRFHPAYLLARRKPPVSLA
uniref:Uncharacterized protein n=1 Tax=Candidatus Kentrum sp. UNK TaxID=2126344 RepID=A0A451ATX5_9GAMM|nr:MAG: hypothetical protein BECKUNK1418G_GA0071005_101342 [Candidatus Kentron sp. UNK]VFK69498.1 MAG: hypothetical protein BECKUNK1418H_GA0071006_101442 [Candidatus Kentron sp. UNK]